MSAPPQWQIAVDTGGTFTDCRAHDGAGGVRRIKVLSSGALRAEVESAAADPDGAVRRLRLSADWTGPDDLVRGFRFRLLGDAPGRAASGVAADLSHLPRVESYAAATRTLTLSAPLARAPVSGTPCELLSPEPAPLLAARLATATPAAAPLPPLAMRLATTWGTNALLTHAGVPPVLFVSAGFADLLEIGTQARPELFARRIVKPPLLHATVVEVGGRLDAAGREVRPLELEALRGAAAEQVRQGRRVAAVALLHADKNPEHEQRVAALLAEIGFTHVSGSAQLAPFIRILPRAETAVVDAYLAPVIRRYLETIERALGRGRLWVMTSAGGLVGGAAYRAKDSLLSGPAGGVAGAVRAGRRCGVTRLIAFDMGGTSTDVARFDGDFQYRFEQRLGDAHLLAPALAIESVAAGGGSICRYDGDRLRVGPASASADPGPACYGAGGPLTLTDVNLLLGRIDPRRFAIPIAPGAARVALDAVRAAVVAGTGEHPPAEELLEGFLEIANQRMADAIRRISLREGYDPADYALIAFGGAGPQHGTGVARLLAIETVIIPPHPALLSADGLAAAVVERFAEEQVLAPLAACGPNLAPRLAALEREARAELAGEGVPGAGTVIRRRVASLRFLGQEATIEVELPGKTSAEALERAFRARYRDLFAHLPERRAVELVSLRVIASTRLPAEPLPEDPRATGDGQETGSDAVVPARHARVRFPGGWQEVPVHEREALAPGAHLAGPCLVLEDYSVTVIDPEWDMTVAATGALVARRTAIPAATVAAPAAASRMSASRVASSPPSPPPVRPEVVRLELFTHRLETIAREMGAQLQRTAVSTNVKERLDFSCAILDAAGRLVVNAPHIPVHLGSLGLCVRAVQDALALRPGDTAITNHPAYGGSHLPDITLITPVDAADGTRLGYVASRAHHAELGGLRPGSMPPDATCLAEEGVVLPPDWLVRAGEGRWAEVERRLTGAPHPTRALEDNLADLRAALAANRHGARALRALAVELGAGQVGETMEALQAHAARRVRAALRALPDGTYRAAEELDDGARLRVRIEVAGEEARVDFGGTSGVHPGNLNTTPAVVRSVVLYVLRLLIDEPLPLNEGLLRAVRCTIPPGMLNPPFAEDPARSPAVVGGNVETSQRLANALIRALGLSAASQGTMNNVLFGDARASYYETVCGGSGAGPDGPGASGVHSHMTNTRITDVEVIEHRHPVRVERFALRRGSGGRGRFAGGEGVVREIRFLAPLSLSLLTQHRRHGPSGLAGGGAGRPGRQRLIRADGRVETLPAAASREVGPGDRLVLETPGGGGYGSPDGERPDGGRPGSRPAAPQDPGLGADG